MISICNKIIFRYLNLFLGFPIGKKATIVDEPKIIKYSVFKYRRAFAKGVMTFDGSVTTFGSITLGLKSKFLVNSLHNIFKSDKIQITYSFNNKSKMWFLRTSARLSKHQLNKWLNYFIEPTEKYKKVYQLASGFQIKPKNLNEAISVFDNKFPKDNKSKINIADVLKVIIYNKKLFIWEIKDKLIKEKNLVSLSYTPIKMYLHVLEKQANIISSEIKMIKFSRSTSNSKLYFLNDLSKWRIPY